MAPAIKRMRAAPYDDSVGIARNVHVGCEVGASAMPTLQVLFLRVSFSENR
jgi:hypothetical protein